MTPDSSSTEPPFADGEIYFTLSPKLVALESPAKTRPAIAIHEMAGQLIAQQVDRGRRGVAVCAPGRSAGTSLLSANLAIAIAQAGVSVLLIDGNLHDSSLDKLIAPSTSMMGLQQVLRDEALVLDDAVQRDILPGLSVLFAGGPCADSSELVGGSRCGELLGSALRNYEYTIVDAPAANRSPDALRLASFIGYGLIVTRRNKTYIDDVATLSAALIEDRAEIIGTVYNAA